MTTFTAPLNLPPGTAERIKELQAEIDHLRYLAESVMDEPVRGPRGGALTVREANERAAKLKEAIDTEEAGGSYRHHRVSLASRIAVYAVVAVVDLPIMLWLTSSVFNVDWGALP